MNTFVKSRIESALDTAVIAYRSISGGCIADTGIATLSDGREVFCKWLTGNEGMFLKEANGLHELAKAKAIKVPAVLHAEGDFLVLEIITPGRRGTDFMETFGRQFAQMHRLQADTHGFYEDNFIGATPQKNVPRTDKWVDFYWTNRLEYQFRLADRHGLSTPEMTKLAGLLENNIAKLLIGSEEPPCVLHGDLWGGNYLVTGDGLPCLIDPAVYYGHREADLGMTHLFGGFNSAFYAAYEEAYPLPAGADHRRGLYMLYHVLNHLNLFGSSYYNQAISILKQYV